MGMHGIEHFLQLIDEVMSIDDLKLAMSDICPRIGFRYFAVSDHVDLRSAPGRAIHLHNYPDQWADYYDGNALGVSDPVHRASHVTAYGFSWSKMEGMIPLTKSDRELLALGRAQGIGDGFTVPVHVPGESPGSCSFANDVGRPLPRAMLLAAQHVGLYAFDRARHLCRDRPQHHDAASPVVTDRQRDCAIWVGRGKSDWEIGRILGVHEETVSRHVRHAMQRYGISKRTRLPIEMLLDGTLTLEDLAVRRYAP